MVFRYLIAGVFLFLVTAGQLQAGDSPEQLKARFAAGEIDQETFLRLLSESAGKSLERESKSEDKAVSAAGETRATIREQRRKAKLDETRRNRAQVTAAMERLKARVRSGALDQAEYGRRMQALQQAWSAGEPPPSAPRDVGNGACLAFRLARDSAKPGESVPVEGLGEPDEDWPDYAVYRWDGGQALYPVQVIDAGVSVLAPLLPAAGDSPLTVQVALTRGAELPAPAVPCPQQALKILPVPSPAGSAERFHRTLTRTLELVATEAVFARPGGPGALVRDEILPRLADLRAGFERLPEAQQRAMDRVVSAAGLPRLQDEMLEQVRAMTAFSAQEKSAFRWPSLISAAHAEPVMVDARPIACPQTPEALDQQLWKSTWSRAATTPEASAYLNAGNAALALSSTLLSASVATEGVVGAGVAEGWGKFVGVTGLATFAWGLVADFGAGLLMSSIDKLEVEVSPARLPEDSEELSGEITRIEAVSSNRGWNISKAAADVLAQIASFGVGKVTEDPAAVQLKVLQRLPAESGASAAARQKSMAAVKALDELEDQFFGQVSRLSRESAFAKGPIQVQPYQCRTNIRKKGWVELRLHHFGRPAFELTGPFHYRAIALGHSDLEVKTASSASRFPSAFAKTTVTLSVDPIEISLEPASRLLVPGQSQLIEATVENAVDRRLGWSLSPADQHRLLQIGDPALVAEVLTHKDSGSFPVRVTARSLSRGGLRASNPEPRLAFAWLLSDAVQVEPAYRCVKPGESVSLKAVVKGPGGKVRDELIVHDLTLFADVEWQAAAGNIDADGTYSAPDTALGEVLITASQRGNPSVRGHAVVNVGCRCAAIDRAERFRFAGREAAAHLEQGLGVKAYAVPVTLEWELSGAYRLSGRQQAKVHLLESSVGSGTAGGRPDCLQRLQIGTTHPIGFVDGEGTYPVLPGSNLNVGPDSRPAPQKGFKQRYYYFAVDDLDGDGRIQPQQDASQFVLDGSGTLEVLELDHERLALRYDLPLKATVRKVVGKDRFGRERTRSREVRGLLTVRVYRGP